MHCFLYALSDNTGSPLPKSMLLLLFLLLKLYEIQTFITDESFITYCVQFDLVGDSIEECCGNWYNYPSKQNHSSKDKDIFFE